MGRKLRTTWNALRPKECTTIVNDMSKRKGFNVGDLIYARDFRAGFPKWCAGIIIKKRGNVMFEIKVENTVWIRHRHQLRNRSSDPQSTIHSDQTQLPFDLLLDAFEIQSSTTSVNTATNSAPDPQLPRRSHRVPKSVDRLQIDPRLPSYTDTSRGRC